MHNNLEKKIEKNIWKRKRNPSYCKQENEFVKTANHAKESRTIIAIELNYMNNLQHAFMLHTDVWQTQPGQQQLLRKFSLALRLFVAYSSYTLFVPCSMNLDLFIRNSNCYFSFSTLLLLHFVTYGYKYFDYKRILKVYSVLSR